MISRTNQFLAGLLALVLLLAVITRVDPSKPNFEVLPDMKYTPAWSAFAENPNFPNGRTMQAPVPGTIARGSLPLHYAATKEDAIRAGEELRNPFALNAEDGSVIPNEASAAVDDSNVEKQGSEKVGDNNDSKDTDDTGVADDASAADGADGTDDAGARDDAVATDDTGETNDADNKHAAENNHDADNTDAADDTRSADSSKDGTTSEAQRRALAEQRLTASIARGGNVYRVFCVSCHGAQGLGDGPVTQRGFPPPPSLLTGKSPQMKDGQLFHILSYGQGSMASFAGQLSHADRWDVINFVRDLQRQSAPGSSAEAAPPLAAGDPTGEPLTGSEPSVNETPVINQPSSAPPTDAAPPKELDENDTPAKDAP